MGTPTALVALGSLFGLAPFAAAQSGTAAGGDQPGFISTVAGTGEFVPGDGGPAIEAAVGRVRDVAVDAVGNLYLSDSANHRVRKVDPTGVITTVAGTGERGHSGDGGPATDAQLAFPYGLAVDSVGDLYIADIGAHRVRRVFAASSSGGRARNTSG